MVWFSSVSHGKVTIRLVQVNTIDNRSAIISFFFSRSGCYQLIRWSQLYSTIATTLYIQDHFPPVKVASSVCGRKRPTIRKWILKIVRFSIAFNIFLTNATQLFTEYHFCYIKGPLLQLLSYYMTSIASP